MPATISVNFTTQAEVIGSNPPATKSVSASVLRSVLDTGGGGSGYVTVASAQTITGAKTFSAAIAGTSSNFSSTITAGTGTNGYARLTNGSATNPGYLAWFTPDNIRRGYVGWQVGTENIGLRVENGWGLNINSPDKPVVIQGDLEVTGNTTGIIPVGAVMGFFTAAAPAGWIALIGQVLTRSQYPNLWAHALASGNIVSQAAWDAGRYGSFHTGDGNTTTGTTFGIPYTAGLFLRGWVSAGGSDPGRVIGSFQSHTMARMTGTLFFRGFNDAGTQQNGVMRYDRVGCGANQFAGSPPLACGHLSYDNARQVATSAENRPVNVPILYCIKF